MSAPRRSTLSFLTALALLFAPSFAAAAAPITLDEIVALLKAGAGESLIVREIGSGAPAFEIGVQETLRLKQAGASDQFILSLMGEPVTDESVPASYRVLKEKTPDGREVLHVTNLDATGKRMGGEIRRPSDAVGPPPRSASEYRVADEAPPAPVIVNVYQPPSQMQAGYAEAYTSPYQYRDPYAYNYPGGILPGYYPHIYASHGYGGNGYGGDRGRCASPGGGPHPGRQSMGAPRHFAGPTYSPIGPATGYDMYRQHTQATLRR